MTLSKVLIADDSRVFRILMTEVLTERGLTVLEASTGREALELIMSQRPQLAILDGLMPLISGFDVIKQVKAEAPNYHPVVFIVTGVYKSQRWKSEAKQQYEVQEYLEKPIEPEDLLAAIKRHFPDLPEPVKKA
jgi:CheY-like chemotaxis protein